MTSRLACTGASAFKSIATCRCARRSSFNRKRGAGCSRLPNSASCWTASTPSCSPQSRTQDGPSVSRARNTSGCSHRSIMAFSSPTRCRGAASLDHGACATGAGMRPTPGAAAPQLLLHELLHGLVLGKSAEHVAVFVSRDAFRQMAVRPFLGDEGRHLTVFDAADPDALPERHIEFLARLRIGRVENVVAVDVEAARPAELPPFGEKFSILVEDLNAVIRAVSDEQSPARVHGESMGHVEFALSLARFAPGLGEFSVLRELHDARVRLSPCPSATKMSPLGATTTSDGPLKVSGPSPATPGLPSVISTFPSELNLMTVWPLPLPPLPSVTQTLPSRSANRPCGQLIMPAPKLVTNLPEASNFWIGAIFEPSQVFAPHRSNTQTLVPSRSTSTPIACPHARPSGSFAQFSSAR